MSLREYKKKRNFKKTPEPDVNGKSKKEESMPIFVVQKHWARRLHYDFRIEVFGVLKSWAIPKGFSTDPNVKQLAIMVEDHPFDYKDFEGEIPKGSYGAGKVVIWDFGTYSIKDIYEKNETEKKVAEKINSGHILLELNGRKLKGGYSLVKIKADEKNSWLLIKMKDEFAGYNLGINAFKYEYLKNDLEKIDFKKTLKAEMPETVRPMLAELKDNSFDDKNWIFEIKWDGYRALAFFDNGKATIKSRQGLEMDFPEILKELKEIPFQAVFDGEIVALNKKGLPSFQLLQNYLKTKRGNAIFFVFDILYLNGFDLKNFPLIERKEILKKLIPDSPAIKYVDHIETSGSLFFEEVKSTGIEGIIGKEKNSHYQEGVRSKSWVKIKNLKRQEMIICGFTAPQKGRKYFGALILGFYDSDNNLVYAGHCGTGFTNDDLKELHEKLMEIKIDKCPFAIEPKTNYPATWVNPLLVCEIKFTEWTEDGIMRQPVFNGLRHDKNPNEIKKEIPQKIESEVEVTNLEKLFWPEDGYTKKDLIEYYEKISEIILPYLKDRPMVLNRFPDGINGKSFYQKDIKKETMKLPSWLNIKQIKSESKSGLNYLICEDKRSLIYMANLGCIEMNTWNSRISNLGNPDYAVLDFDPEDGDFYNARKVALETHKILEKLEVEHYIKTSGRSGIHIYIPLGGKYSHKQAQDFAKVICQITLLKARENATLLRNPQKRSGKVYLDFLQNGEGKTIVSPYSLRPVPGANVSTPIFWEELEKGIKPEDFNIKTIFDRISKYGDIWKGLLGPGIDMEKILDKISVEFEL